MKQFVYIALLAGTAQAIRLSDEDNSIYTGLVQTLGVGEANEVINNTQYTVVSESNTAIQGLASLVGAEEAAKIEKGQHTQSLAQGVPVGINPVTLEDTMGEEDLGFEIKLGVEDLSILKIKNHHNRLNQDKSSTLPDPEKPTIVSGGTVITGLKDNEEVHGGAVVGGNAVTYSQAPKGTEEKKEKVESHEYTKVSMLAETKDQDDEIARLSHKLEEDKAKLAEAQKAKVDAAQFVKNNLATETQGGSKYTLEDMVNDKSVYADVNKDRQEKKDYLVDYVRWGQQKGLLLQQREEPGNVQMY